ncbi:MAG: hypothetical protein V4706_01845 [Pseudomonadota bacterium]
MKLTYTVNSKPIQAALEQSVKQAQFATMQAINKSAEKAKEAVVKRLPIVFDRPTSWVLNSLRIQYAKDRVKPVAYLAFKDSWSSSGGETGGRTMILPHVDGGNRAYKGMEVRLMRMGMLPSGWSAVPGAAAVLDGNGNMSRGQISQLLNVLGAYTESGFNKANIKTVKRLQKGNAKKGVYGFTYWVNPVGGVQGKHIPPGVYQRVITAFGTSLKPVLIFVRRAQYGKRLDFYGIAHDAFEKAFPAEFKKTFEEAMRTAFLRTQGSLL